MTLLGAFNAKRHPTYRFPHRICERAVSNALTRSGERFASRRLGECNLDGARRMREKIELIERGAVCDAMTNIAKACGD